MKDTNHKLKSVESNSIALHNSMLAAQVQDPEERARFIAEDGAGLAVHKFNYVGFFYHNHKPVKAFKMPAIVVADGQHEPVAKFSLS